MECLQNNSPSYSLKSSVHFTPTSDLKCALSSFLCSCKGIHIALICQDNPLDIDELFNLFEKKYSKIDISKVSENAWVEGFYFYCAKFNNIQDAFQEVINCINALGKDVTQAQNDLNTLNNDISINDEYKLPQSSTWTLTRAISISNSLLQQSELAKNCADIRILILLPLNCFYLFKENNCYFPSFVECVVKGITLEQKLKEELSATKEELSATKEELSVVKEGISIVQNLIHEILETIRTSSIEKGIKINEHQIRHIALDIVYEFKDINIFENTLDLSSPQKFKDLVISSKYKVEKEMSKYEAAMASDSEKKCNICEYVITDKTSSNDNRKKDSVEIDR